MKVKKIITLIIICYFAAIALIFSMIRNTEYTQLNLIEVNNIIQTVRINWVDSVEEFDLPVFDYQLDFVVITNNNEVLAATRDGLNTDIHSAIANRDTIADVVTVDGEIIGKVIFYNNSSALFIQEHIRVVRVVTIILTLFTIGIVGYIMYMYEIIVRPFQKLEGFAKQVAAGNLEIPLEMDKQNLFGAFTESFDLMREELHKARENAREANQSKKELVAQLSHDIKTPVASIKAVTELMHVLAKDDREKERLEIISTKADQINALITDMFHATLEELKALSVNVQEIESPKITEILTRVDYNEQLKPFFIPNALIISDLLRTEQVFDNIITNAYKYAKTEIEVNAYFKDDFLAIEIMDFGAGVSAEELPLLLQKFYRGENVGEEKGYGLGLHISNYLLEQMDGMLELENRDDGFTARVMFKLVGKN